jgi:putative copper export protein
MSVLWVVVGAMALWFGALVALYICAAAVKDSDRKQSEVLATAHRARIANARRNNVLATRTIRGGGRRARSGRARTYVGG